jgi:2-methylaconitate cis-trans-isomerase PrpF
VPHRIPIVLMRGGTSKCIFFHERDLPAERQARDRILLAVFGSPDPRQIDGLGGATSTTSKACIIGPPSRPDADVDYTFAQVSVTAALVDCGGNCGNCSSAVGPFAVDEGLVPAVEPVTRVRIHNTNTGKIIVAEVPTRGGRALDEGDYEIAGVPGTGARIRMWFEDPSGAVTGKLLPTGQAVEDCEGVPMSVVDAANPLVFVRAADLGLRGTELPLQIDSDPELLGRIERIRGEAAVRCGLAGDWREAARVTPSVPKFAFVSEPQDYTDLYGRRVAASALDFTARIMSMGRLHQAYALTGAICTGVAARLPGTLVHALRRGEGPDVRFGHPSGVIDVQVETDGDRVLRVAGSRTARRMLEGTVHLRDSSLASTPAAAAR